MGLFNVALDHMQRVVVMGGRQGAYLSRLLRGAGEIDCPSYGWTVRVVACAAGGVSMVSVKMTRVYVPTS